MKTKITATIKTDPDDKGLWMFIDNGDESNAWPITKEEIKPIMEACQKYLEEGNEN